MYRRIVFAAAQGVSFEDASEALAELGELPLLPKRVWRAAKRVGAERAAECRVAADADEQLTLPVQQQSPLAQVPRMACVQMDGGRFQQRPRSVAERSESAGSESAVESDREGFWREYKAGVLL